MNWIYLWRSLIDQSAKHTDVLVTVSQIFLTLPEKDFFAILNLERLLPDGTIASVGFSWKLWLMLKLVSFLDGTCAFVLFVEPLPSSCCRFAIVSAWLTTLPLTLVNVAEPISLSFEWRCSRPEEYKKFQSWLQLRRNLNRCHLESVLRIWICLSITKPKLRFN